MLESILRAHPAHFGKILDNAADFKFQVLLSEISEDESGAPCLVRHCFRSDSEYFYPASSVKLCAAVAALQKLQRLRLEFDVSCSSPLAFHPLNQGGKIQRDDYSNLNDHSITISHEIRKLSLVSDSEAFNRLYDFVGHRLLNQTMWEANLRSTRLRHRLAGDLSVTWNNFVCRPIEVDSLLTFPPKRSKLQVPKTEASGLLVGRAYRDPENNLVNEPMDFSEKNYMSLLDLQNLLVKITRPDVQVDGVPLGLDQGSLLLLTAALSQYPGDSRNPRYDRKTHPDDFSKFFLPGLCRVRSKGAFRVYNKVGRAFGFTTDNAYIFDLETGRSFYLTATIYTNANGILNDDVYEYQSVADKVMSNLAEVLARAFWRIPPNFRNLSTTLDCVPSSLQNPTSGPGGALHPLTAAVEARKPEKSSSEMKPPSSSREPVYFKYFLDQ